MNKQEISFDFDYGCCLWYDGAGTSDENFPLDLKTINPGETVTGYFSLKKQ